MSSEALLSISYFYPNMKISRTPLQFGVGIGTFGVLVYILTTFLLFVFPQHVLSGDAGNVFVAAWFDPISMVGRAIVFSATPLFAGICSLYLVRSGISVRRVLTGLAVGAIAFGVGIALVSLAVTGSAHRGPPLEYVGQTTRQTARMVGLAIVGALVGKFSGEVPNLVETSG